MDVVNKLLEQNVLLLQILLAIVDKSILRPPGIDWGSGSGLYKLLVLFCRPGRSEQVGFDPAVDCVQLTRPNSVSKALFPDEETYGCKLQPGSKGMIE
jgi:hypothetical protein